MNEEDAAKDRRLWRLTWRWLRMKPFAVGFSVDHLHGWNYIENRMMRRHIVELRFGFFMWQGWWTRFLDRGAA